MLILPLLGFSVFVSENDEVEEVIRSQRNHMTQTIFPTENNKDLNTSGDVIVSFTVNECVRVRL